MANRNVILQWNCRGQENKKLHLQQLISEYSPAIICLQETLLALKAEQSLKNGSPLPKAAVLNGYTPYLKCIDSGKNGVAIYVRNNVIHSPVRLNTRLQALAVRVTFQDREFIVSNHYTSDKHDGTPTKDEFQAIVDKFELPYIMCGDFNAKSTLWGNDEDNKRGTEIEKFLFKNDLTLLNTDVKTRYDNHHKKYSLIDLSISHSDLYLDFECKVLNDPHDSDHHPIIISITGELLQTDKIPKWNFKRADWSSFRQQCKSDISNDLFSEEDEEITVFTEKLVEIACEHIPMTSAFQQKRSKPWFDEECKAAKRERNRANRLNKRYPCLNNAIKAKIANAKARRTFNYKKRESWKKYVSSINSRTPTNKVWNMIRKITGKNIPSNLLHLKDENGNAITNKTEIINKLGSTFENNSSSANYSKEFQKVKKAAEEKPLDFTTKDNKFYNKKFRLRDLKRAIKKSKDTSPGPDSVHYKLLKNLPDETLKILLKIINRHWDSGTFPESWKKALLLPIPKPGKDHQNPNNFRPIALTSCLCKTVERMVNERLVYYLEKTKKLTKFQAGFRSERSTLDQLVRLDTFVKDAFANGEHVVAVFFDLAKAYDTTWKYGIMRDLHTMGLRGNLPIFIQNFLSDRTFQILFNATLSEDTFIQEEGVPQGAILSTTLFNVKLNDISKELTTNIKCSLYVDDFNIFIRSSNPQSISRQLQLNINRIVSWTQKNGFTVSVNKTVAMHFCKCRYECSPPSITLNNAPIEFVREHKFLGLIWDPRLNFNAHINYIRGKAVKALNIMRVLSNYKWGSDSKTLLRIFRSLVRSKLDYGCIVYGYGDKSALAKLDVVHRSGIRLSLGAFKSSPKEALYVEANEPPLEIRRKELAMRYALKIKSNPNNPVYDSLFHLPYSAKYEKKPYEPIGESIKKLFREADINKSKILVNSIPSTPIWESETNDVNFEMSIHDKSSTNPEFFKSKFLSDILPQYKNYQHFYTDGSKHENIAGYGIYDKDRTLSRRISNDSSIFTAEIEAIKRVLLHIDEAPLRQDMKYVIFCDSKSVLESIDIQVSRNPLILNILDSIQKIKTDNKTLKFCWIPSHVGIRGNELADQKARDSLFKPEPIDYKFPYNDYYPKVKSLVKKKWQERWDKKHNEERPIKLHDINPFLKPFHSTHLTRKEEVLMHRLRIGHTRLTHRYLMEDPLKREPPCNFCYDDWLSVKHILIECHHFDTIRNRHYRAADLKDLFDKVPHRHILGFLREARLFNEI